MDTELEQRWQQIERLKPACPACGGKAWQRGGTLSGFDLARQPESEHLKDLVSPVYLARVCAACGCAVLFLRDV